MKLIHDADIDPKKLGRNDPCLCGSGQKYKKCCLPKEELRGSQYMSPEASRLERELILKKVGKIFEDKSKNMSIEEMNNYFKGKSFDEIDEEYEAIAGHDPKSEAEEILSEAYEAPTSTLSALIAEKALKHYPNLPDAYCILAHEKAKSHDEAISYFRKAIEVGKIDLGEEFFKENEGHFWGMTESRPYMRAKSYLADALIHVKKYDEAIVHFEDCIRLNPNDNQGVRDELLCLYLQLDRIKDAEKLIEKYNEDFSAAADYGRALYLFKKEGADSVEAIKKLNAARKNNPHVAPYLTGKKKLPRNFPETYQLGSKDEAVLYCEMAALAWISTDGAIQWLSEWT